MRVVPPQWPGITSRWWSCLALVGAVAGAALYALAWQAQPAAGGQTPPAPAGDASNVTPQPSAPAQTAAPNPQPSPGAPPQGAQGVPVIILNPPADVPPVGTNAAAGQSAAPANSAPAVVVEGGAQPPEDKAPRTDATNPADSQRAGEAGKKDEPKGDDARAGEEEPRRDSQGQGAEIRTAAPARPSAQPSSPARAQPSPTPKKKVIQWP